MDILGQVSWAFCLMADVLILVGCVWACRRFQLRSVPWILGFFILQQILPILTSHFGKQVIAQHSASGNEPFLLGMTFNDFAVTSIYASSIIAAIANLLIACLIISELVYAYSNAAAPQPAIPAFILMPVQHSYAVGIALLFCVLALPLFWFAVFIMWK
jgi:hypothetical protein